MDDGISRQRTSFFFDVYASAHCIFNELRRLRPMALLQYSHLSEGQ